MENTKNYESSVNDTFKKDLRKLFADIEFNRDCDNFTRELIRSFKSKHYKSLQSEKFKSTFKK